MTIRDPRLARTFTNNRKASLLLMFVNGPLSVSDAAAAIGQSVAKTYYHVTTLVRQGLLVVAKERKRDGRAVKYYQSVAPSFFLPVELTGRLPLEALATELREALQDKFLGDNFAGTLFSADKEGNPDIRAVASHPRGRPAAELWHVIRLTDERAIALVKEMQELVGRYQAGPEEGAEYLVHAALAARRSPE